MLRRLTELRVPSWSARTKLHAPSRPASGGRPGHGKTPPFLPEDWSTSAASSSPLSTRSRNRVRYKAWCVCVPVRGVCGVVRGAWGAGGIPVASGLMRLLGLRVLGVSCFLSAACCPRFCVGLRVPWHRCISSVSSCTLRCLCGSAPVFVAAWCACPSLIGSARVVSGPKARLCAAPCT